MDGIIFFLLIFLANNNICLVQAAKLSHWVFTHKIMIPSDLLSRRGMIYCGGKVEGNFCPAEGEICNFLKRFASSSAESQVCPRSERDDFVVNANTPRAAATPAFAESKNNVDFRTCCTMHQQTTPTIRCTLKRTNSHLTFA